MELEFIRSPNAPEAIGPYSHAVAAGEWVFCSGQIPKDPATGQMRNGSAAEATHQVLLNLQSVLASAGCALSDVVKVTVFLADLADFAEMNAVYAEHFGSHRPARSTVQVAKLPGGARVEIDAIAVRGQS